MAMEKYYWVTRRSWRLIGRCLWRGEGVNGDEKVLNGDREALKDDGKDLNGNEEALKSDRKALDGKEKVTVDTEALKGVKINGEALTSDWEALKGNGEAFGANKRH